MSEVRCTYCDWEGYMGELKSGEDRLNMWSVCPECGSTSQSDYLEVLDGGY